ncbi:MAG: hypothetical protein INQ03_07745 [Candidatus Heimdallarchaeota archaeon]|nr:hypothetical protein [Candidatus Heimdallarchaeota archaeon]
MDTHYTSEYRMTAYFTLLAAMILPFHWIMQRWIYLPYLLLISRVLLLLSITGIYLLIRDVHPMLSKISYTAGIISCIPLWPRLSIGAFILFSLSSGATFAFNYRRDSKQILGILMIISALLSPISIVMIQILFKVVLFISLVLLMRILYHEPELDLSVLDEQKEEKTMDYQ